MKITDLLTKELIALNLKSASKIEVVKELIDVLDREGRLNDKEAYFNAIMDRESQSSTGLGEGIAIPHAKTSAVKTPSIVFGRSTNGVDYDALDGAPTHLFFMIAASEGANQQHLETLSRLSTYLMDPDFKQAIENASTAAEVLQAIENKEDEKKEEEVITGKLEVLAVTACPTGIAHTFMAADALKNTAKELGIAVKVQTNGSSGIGNPLTAEDINEAKAIIVAADTKVDMAPFDGKKVIKVPVAKAIKQPKELLQQAAAGDASVYRHDGEAAGDSNEQKSGFYQHLMNGVSNMLPFVVGGGILIALSFIFGINAADPSDPSYHPIAEALSIIGGGNAFGLMIPVLAAFIASSIADRPGFAPGMVGGLIAASGGAGFLGGLIAGFLAGYLVVGLKKVFRVLPTQLEGIKPVLLYPVFGILFAGLIMLFLTEPLSAFNKGIVTFLESMGTSNLVLLGFVLAAMMAIDMGGPINKAAFTFGIAMIDAGNLAPHAAVMAGGMVPPLGIALATTLFKHKFTASEREAGKTNYIMGASFITEGAIPFAAADPARVIPSAVIGSGIAGALTMLFGIGLPAPHGGAFVIPLVEGNPLLYVAAILIGAAVTAVLVGTLKKTKA